MQDHTDTINPEAGLPPVDAAERIHRNRQDRLERQARVGILRNPKSPPRPPSRRAALMGRWPKLRSSRRPRDSAVEDAAQAVVTRLVPVAEGARGPLAVRRDAEGRVQSIDLAGLMASVDSMGSAAPVRTPFAASIRADGTEAEAPPPAPAKPAILTPAAWIDDQDDPVEDQDALGQAFRDAAEPPVTDAAPSPRRRGLWIVGLGVLIALTVLVILPATGILRAT
ncbi:hypothetical protein [Pararhodobacter aggregans]|uniref:hypothetical protein n=1 Tax=Pararhodobacter aggregans TaxID=404875 RepID=UPI000D42D8FE|nr:hypothetical protein [Pararhodobacter aggregans]PTX02991.1 hypothetical protein C8N33_104353 [Pararhodobacter aggregans]